MTRQPYYPTQSLVPGTKKSNAKSNPQSKKGVLTVISDTKDNIVREVVQQKYCRACSKLKPLSEYHIDRASKDGHVKVCKSCAAERTKARAVRERELKEDAAMFEATRNFETSLPPLPLTSASLPPTVSEPIPTVPVFPATVDTSPVTGAFTGLQLTPDAVKVFDHGKETGVLDNVPPERVIKAPKPEPVIFDDGSKAIKPAKQAIPPAVQHNIDQIQLKNRRDEVISVVSLLLAMPESDSAAAIAMVQAYRGAMKYHSGFEE